MFAQLLLIYIMIFSGRERVREKNHKINWIFMFEVNNIKIWQTGINVFVCLTQKAMKL